MNTNLYKISNARLISRVLPFFARGRRMMLFLESVSAPLARLHKKFLDWALLMLIKSCVTSQTEVLIWYINYVLGNWFKEEGDSCYIEESNELNYLTLTNVGETIYTKIFGSYTFNTDSTDRVEGIYQKPVSDDVKMTPHVFTIWMPAIKDASDWNKKRYFERVKELVDEYNVTNSAYIIAYIG